MSAVQGAMGKMGEEHDCDATKRMVQMLGDLLEECLAKVLWDIYISPLISLLIHPLLILSFLNVDVDIYHPPSYQLPPRCGSGGRPLPV